LTTAKMPLQFIDFLTEARLFTDATTIKGKSVEDIASIVYLMIMMLEITRHTNHSYAVDYASKTMIYSSYENLHYAGTDLGNLLAVLNNQDTFKGQLTSPNKGIAIPLFQINRYLNACKGSSFDHNSDAQFFYRLEDYLKLYSKANFRQFRRDIGDWRNLSYADKNQVVQKLRQEFDKRASTCDIYIWWKQSFKLKESAPAKSPVEPTAPEKLYLKLANEGKMLYSEILKELADYPLIPTTINTKLGYHDKLNPALWYDGELIPDVKEALGKIANKFSEFIDVKQIKIVDYIITGSNCAFNYTDESDIDIHVLVDATGLGENPLTSPFLLAKKALWNSGHNITVKGYDVELYAEDVNDTNNKLVATGIYSLLQDRWIKKPEYVEVKYDDAAVQTKAEDIMNQIDELISTGEPDQAQIDKLWEHIYKMRRSGLATGGEFDVSNLAFKVIRNYGYLTKLRDFEQMREDEDLTLEHIVQ